MRKKTSNKQQTRSHFQYGKQKMGIQNNKPHPMKMKTNKNKNHLYIL